MLRALCTLFQTSFVLDTQCTAALQTAAAIAAYNHFHENRDQSCTHCAEYGRAEGYEHCNRISVAYSAISAGSDRQQEEYADSDVQKPSYDI